MERDSASRGGSGYGLPTLAGARVAGGRCDATGRCDSHGRGPHVSGVVSSIRRPPAGGREPWHGTTSEGFQCSEEKLQKLIADLRAVGVPMIGVYGTQLEQPQSHQVLRQDDEARPTRTDSRGREHPQPDAPSHTLRSATTNRLRKCHWPSSSFPLQSSVT